MRRAYLGLGLLALVGCVAERDLEPITPCTTRHAAVSVDEITSADVADVLVVVDESRGMDAPRAALAAAMPRFLDGLARGDLDHDGLREATPMRSIHVAIASSDHGCRDGSHLARLVHGPDTDARGIVALDAGDGTTSDQAAAAVMSTLDQLGDDGCVSHWPAETAIDAIALLPRDDDGLVRPSGVLIVLVVTSTDDLDAGRLAQLRGFRPDPDMIVLGIVSNLDEQGAAACVADEVAPATTLAQAATDVAALGIATVLSPICALDDGDALDRVSRATARCVIGPDACLQTSFERDDLGLVPASLVEVLPEIGSGARYTHCSELAPAGVYERVGIEAGEGGDREVCLVHQIGAPAVIDSSEAGWFWDDGSFGRLLTNPEGCASSIGLHGTAYVVGAEVRLRWDVHSTNESRDVACANDADCTLAGLVAHACDALDHVCVSPTCR